MSHNPTTYLTSGYNKPEGTILGIGLTCPSPEFAQICGNSGFDVVLIDMEHGPISNETAYRMVTALTGTAAEAWIRVAANDPTLCACRCPTLSRPTSGLGKLSFF